MASPAQAQSQAPANTESAAKDSKSAPKQPDPELDYSRPIECDGINSPIPIGNDRQSGVRSHPVRGRFKAGTIDGLVDRVRYLPGGAIELRIKQSTHADRRGPGDVCWAIVTPSGMVCEVAAPREDDGEKGTGRK